ncbi:MAG TPA: hypothetical protein H9679_05825 [Firmicutes bacterium]|nr:hypothetical protein [Bacillota bacterium]
MKKPFPFPFSFSPPFHKVTFPLPSPDILPISRPQTAFAANPQQKSLTGPFTENFTSFNSANMSVPPFLHHIKSRPFCEKGGRMVCLPESSRAEIPDSKYGVAFLAAATSIPPGPRKSRRILEMLLKIFCK